MKIFFTFLFIASMAMAQLPDTWKLENVLPSHTFALLGINENGNLCEAMRNSNITKFLQEKECQDLLASVPEELLQRVPKDQIKQALKLLGPMWFSVVEVKSEIPTALFVWDTKGNPELFAGLFEQLKQKAYAKAQLSETVIEKYGYSITIVEKAKLPLCFTFAGSYFLLCTNLEYLSEILDPNYQQANPLSGSEQYKKVKQELMQGNPGAYVYLNLKDIRTFALENLQEHPKFEQLQMLLDLSGLNAVDALALGFSLRNGQIAESFYLYTPQGRTGILGKLLPGLQVPQTLTAYIPEKTLALEHGPLNLWTLYETWTELMKSMKPEEYEMVMKHLQKMEQEFGINLEEFLKSLGDEYLWTISCSNSLLPDVSFNISLKDPEKMKQIIAQLLKLVPEKFKYLVSWQGQEFVYFNFSTKREPIPVAPTIGVSGNRLLITLYPETHKRLSQVQNGVLPADLKIYIQDRPYTLAGYLNLKSLIVPLYRTALPLAQAMLPRAELPFEPALLPPAELLEKYFGNFAFIAQHDQQGLLWEFHSPIGVITWAAIGGFVGYHKFHKPAPKPRQPRQNKPK